METHEQRLPARGEVLRSPWSSAERKGRRGVVTKTQQILWEKSHDPGTEERNNNYIDGYVYQRSPHLFLWTPSRAIVNRGTAQVTSGG